MKNNQGLALIYLLLPLTLFTLLVFTTPLTEKIKENLPTATDSQTGEQGSLDVGKNSYTRGEKMEITVKNHSQGPVATTNHRYACQIVSLEQLVGSQWQVITDTCGSAMATTTVVLEAGEEKTLTLPTSTAGGLLAYELNPGTYRLRFDYVAGREAIFTPDQAKEIKTFYSARFQIR